MGNCVNSPRNGLLIDHFVYDGVPVFGKQVMHGCCSLIPAIPNQHVKHITITLLPHAPGTKAWLLAEPYINWLIGFDKLLAGIPCQLKRGYFNGFHLKFLYCGP